jgi:hypothetical protein
MVVPNCPLRGEVRPVIVTGFRTVTVPEFVRVQPVMPSVTTTEYVVVVVGETLMEAVVAFPGVHRKLGLDALCVAVNVVESPRQMVAELTVSVGSGFTVTVPEPLPEQVVVPSVTVTV